jgi:transcriptional regulator with XRE-family HTH domain
MERFAEELKARRERKNWSQRDLSRESGDAVSDSYISLIESGKKPTPSRKIVRALAAALGDHSGYLMKLADHDRLPPGAQQTIERTQERVKKMKFERERERELSLTVMLLQGEIHSAIAPSQKTEQYHMASFFEQVFWELFQEGLVELETCQRYTEYVEKFQGRRETWPPDLPLSPFDLVTTLMYKTDPPNYDKAEQILRFIKETYPTLLPGKPGASPSAGEESPRKPEGAPDTPPEEPKPPIDTIGT